MLRQYNPQRFAIVNGRRVGTIAVGTVFRCSDGRRNDSWIVEAWHPRELGAAKKDDSGRYVNSFLAGGHLATVRCLRNGKRTRLADHHIRRLIGD